MNKFSKEIEAEIIRSVDKDPALEIVLSDLVDLPCVRNREIGIGPMWVPILNKTLRETRLEGSLLTLDGILNRTLLRLCDKSEPTIYSQRHNPNVLALMEAKIIGSIARIKKNAPDLAKTY